MEVPSVPFLSSPAMLINFPYPPSDTCVVFAHDYRDPPKSGRVAVSDLQTGFSVPTQGTFGQKHREVPSI